jgi:hypothetical protein
MVWYAVSLFCAHELFWKTIWIIDSAINNIQLPQDSTGVALVVDGWAVKREARDGFATNMGTISSWPGTTNDIMCFQQTPLFNALKEKMLPEYIHIVADEAYSALAAECNGQILTPYSIHQLNAVKKKDDENQIDYFQRVQHNPALIVPRPVSKYWKMRAFNHELSSERITIK